MKSKTKSTRQSNLELLRIVSMVMIITLHFLGHGGVLENVRLFSRDYFLSWFLEGISFIAVNCYVLISGYFLVNSDFKLKKLIILLLQVLFYSIGIYLILLAIGAIPFSLGSAIKAFIPTLSNQYWFITVYVGLYILSPFLNIAIKAMSKKQHLLCIIVLCLLFSVIPNLLFFAPDFNFGMGIGIVWFIVLYFIAAYIRLYYIPSYRTKKYFLLYTLIAILVPVSKFLITLLSKTFLVKYIGADALLGGSSLFYAYNSILVLLASVLMFMTFINFNINGAKTRIINMLSSLTLGVYLIHDNSNLREILWNFVNAKSHIDRWEFPLFIVFVVFSIYLLSSIIDFLRSKLFSKIISGKWLDIFCTQIEKNGQKLFSRLHLS